MASIKVKFHPSTVADHKGLVFYRIIHEREVRQLSSQYHIFNYEWDNRRSMPTAFPTDERRDEIYAIREQIRRDVERLSRIIHLLDCRGVPFTADDIIDAFRRFISEYSLSVFLTSIVAKLKSHGQIRTSETYCSALKSFRRFLAETRRNEDIMIDCLDSGLMQEYESWLRCRGVSPNSSSFYMRILRAVYNRAVECEIIENRHPFRRVYTGVDKTVKRALPLDEIRKIKSMNLSNMPKLDFARDMFVMSFMLRGMSFVDMAFLRKSDRRNGYVTYRRRKTGQQLTIAWTNEMQRILDKYPENKTDYLLPVINKCDVNERTMYRNMSYLINCSLKKVGEMAGIATPLTLYVARHSWASVARAKGIPVSVISEGMGHDSEMTTRIYLASLDTSVIDRANSLIISSI